MGLKNRTSAKDKFILARDMNKEKVVKKETKASRLSKMAKEIKEKGGDWKEHKKNHRQNSI